MKILMTAENFLPRVGGAEIHVKCLIDNLLSEGHTVTFITNELRESEYDKKIKIIKIRWNKKNIIATIRAIWFESKNVDIIHCHCCYRLAFVSGIIGKIRRVPVIVTLHGMGILDMPGIKRAYRITHSIYRYFSLKLAAYIISTSKDLAIFAYKYIQKNKIKIIKNGYDNTVFNSRIEAPDEIKRKYHDKKVIVTVRRLVPKNGIHYLIEAMPYIIKEVPDLRYIAIGQGRMRKYLEKRIIELKIEKHIELLGRLDNEKVPQYLKIADVIVFPSTAESSSLACAEAMAMGKSVVASRVGGLIELIGENNERGKLVKLVEWEASNYDAPMKLNPESYKRLAQAIIDVTNNKDKEREQRAMKYARDNLSWKIIFQKTMKVYKQFIVK